jgi:hypothetical protein
MSLIPDFIEDAYNEGKKAAETVGNAASDVANAFETVVDTSKGVDYFVYLNGGPFKVNVSSRGSEDRTFASDSKDLVGKIQQGHCEIHMSNIKDSEHTGRFQIAAGNNDAIYLSKYAEIAPSTGNLGDSDMKDMLQTPSIVKDNFAVSYGFYDAGADESHQAYMYVTDNYSNWMGNLVDKMSELEKNKSFGNFVLPGSHDAGMFTGIYSDEQARDLINRATNYVPGGILIQGGTSTARRILINFAYTQKDDINKQLLLGVRYFDFRPGYNIANKDNKLRHQHFFVPGYEFDKFLSDVVSFLKTHTREIVVVNVQYSGFATNNMKPDEGTINSYIDQAISGSDIQKGGINDLNKTVKELFDAKTRLIFLYQKDDGNCRNSYNIGESYYKTNDVNQIVAALDQTFSNPKFNAEKDWTVLQLQSTYNGTWGGGAKGVATLSDASSPLLSTKAKFDYKTYDWVSNKENVASRCGGNLLVLLNDFVDNALVSHSIAITKQRLK